MKRIAAKKIKQTVLVVGDESSDKQAFIQKCTHAQGISPASSLVSSCTIPFGNNAVELAFSSAEPSVTVELARSADVIVFCFNINIETSYEAMLACLNRLHQYHAGIIALVACVSKGECTPQKSSVLQRSQQLDSMLSRVHPKTYLQFFISKNLDDTCGVAQLFLNLLADKALKLDVAKPVIVLPEAKAAPKRPKPTLALNGLVLGAAGVGKSSVICQVAGYQSPGQYQQTLEPTHQWLEFEDHDVVLTLTDTSSLGELPKGKAHFAILCFDINDHKTLTLMFDQIKALIQRDKKMLFALLGNKRDLMSSDDLKRGLAEEVSLLTATLADLYPYHFMGLYLNSTIDKRYDQVPLLINILCENYFDKLAEEKALVAKFKQAHQSMPTHLFSRTNIPDDADLDFLIHNASREDVETRSNMVFKSLGWFDRRGHLAATAPELIKQRRHSLDMAGISYAKKLNSGS